MNRYANASIKITVVISTAASIGLINLLPLMNVVFFKSNHLTLTLSVYMFTVICFVNNDEYLIITSSNQYSSHYYGCDNRNTVQNYFKCYINTFWGIVGASVSTVLSLLLLS